MDRRVETIAYLLMIFLVVLGCSMGKRAANSLPSNQSNQPTSRSTSQPVTETTPSRVEPGALSVGQATGSYTAKGETVELKYAYAGRGERFGSDSVIILLTDKPIPPDAVAEEIKSQPMFYDQKIRGLEYVIMKDGYWVRYHPSQYQESKSSELKDYAVENGTVRGSDEDKGDVVNGKYSRSVKFVAALPN